MPQAPDHPRLCDRLKSTVRDLVALTANVGPARLRRAPGPDEWSAAMVIAHLADSEMAYGVRLRLLLTEPRPVLAPFDDNAWVERFSSLDQDPKDTLTRWRVLREANVRIFESLEDTEWKQAGVQVERGEQTVEQIAVLLADHDRNHLDQIRRTLAEGGRG
ncbi:MAG TPA: DinB family protein [Acidimicrobiales bacterium]